MADAAAPSIANVAAAAARPLTDKEIQAVKMRDEAKAKLVAAGVEKVSGNNVMGLVTVLKKGPADVDAAVREYIAGLPARRDKIKTAKKAAANAKAALAPPKPKKTAKKKNTNGGPSIAELREYAQDELTTALRAAGVEKGARAADVAKLVALREKDPAAANVFFQNVVSRKGKIRSSEKARAAVKRAATAAKKKNTATKPKSGSKTRKSPKTGLAKRVAAMLDAMEISPAEVCKMCASGSL